MTVFAQFLLANEAKSGAKVVSPRTHLGKGGKCALIVGSNIDPKVAELFARNHFLNSQPDILTIPELLSRKPNPLKLLREQKPQAFNQRSIDGQPLYILVSPLADLYEYINSLLLFEGVQPRKGWKPQQVLTVFGYSPEELPNLIGE